MENLLIDHDHLIRLDKENAYDKLLQLVEQNGAEVVILDTAYKFLGGDIESSAALSRAFEVLDKVIHETGTSIVMTHHLRKSAGGKGKENTDVADPDGVAGSFLWTGWPNRLAALWIARPASAPGSRMRSDHARLRCSIRCVPVRQSPRRATSPVSWGTTLNRSPTTP